MLMRDEAGFVRLPGWEPEPSNNGDDPVSREEALRMAAAFAVIIVAMLLAAHLFPHAFAAAAG